MYIPFFLCWGSFLNVLAYRLIQNKSIVTPRSFCPHCHTTIYWYDNIPVISWLLLQGKCRTCKKQISVLYPLIELMTTLLLSWLYVYIPHAYFIPYFVFVSALIVTIRSDIETMLISPFMTIYLAPIAFLFSWFDMIPISLLESIAGAAGGYLFLYTVNYVFKKIKHQDGIGEGDFDLLFLIGAFTGIIGCWASVTIGSAVGSLIGITYLGYERYWKKNSFTHSTKIPFGPFLALGAITYIFLQVYLY